MHAIDDIQRALELGGRGLGPTEISARLGLPRKTVGDWLNGRIPRGGAAFDLCDACGHAAHLADRLPPSYVYLLGVYLGDGCISAHARGVFRLRIFLDVRYPGIVEEVAKAMRDVRPRNRVRRADHAGNYAPHADGRRSCVELSSYSRSWPCLLPQHGPGKKHDGRIFLADWQRPLVQRHPGLLVRGLIHSDGCRFVNTGRGGWRHPRYSFNNLSADIRAIFSDACTLLGLHWTSANETIYVSRKADVARLDQLVGPKT